MATESAPVPKKCKSRYTMPKRYATFLKAAVYNNNNFKRSEARDMMINYFGYEGKHLPPDFPSLEQVQRRVNTVRAAHKKAVAAETENVNAAQTIASSSTGNASIANPSDKSQ